MVSYIILSDDRQHGSSVQQLSFTKTEAMIELLDKKAAYLGHIRSIIIDMNDPGAGELLAYLSKVKHHCPIITVDVSADIILSPQAIQEVASSIQAINNITTLDTLNIAQYAYSNNDIDLLDNIGIRPPTEEERKHCRNEAELLERRITTGITMQEFQYRAQLSPQGTKVPKEIKLIKGDKEITTDQKDIPTLDSTQLIITAGKGADMVTTDNRTRLPYTIKQLHESDIDAARRYARVNLGYRKPKKLEHIDTIEITPKHCDLHIATADIPNTHIKAGMLYRDKPRTVVLKDKKFKRHAIERHFEVTSANKAKHSFESPALKDVARQLAKIMRVTRIAKRSSQQFMVNRLENASISVANKKHAISSLLPSRQTVRGWGQHALNQLPTTEGTYNYWTTGAIPDLIHYVRHEGRPIERTINSGYYLRTGQVTYPTIHHDGPLALDEEHYEILQARLAGLVTNPLAGDEDGIIANATIDQWINDTFEALDLQPNQRFGLLQLIYEIIRNPEHEHYLGNYDGIEDEGENFEQHENIMPVLHRMKRKTGISRMAHLGNSMAYFFNRDNPEQHYLKNDYPYNYQHNPQREGSRKHTLAGAFNSLAWKLSRTTTSHASWGKLYNREKPFWTGYKPFNIEQAIIRLFEGNHFSQTQCRKCIESIIAETPDREPLDILIEIIGLSDDNTFIQEHDLDEDLMEHLGQVAFIYGHLPENTDEPIEEEVAIQWIDNHLIPNFIFPDDDDPTPFTLETLPYGAEQTLINIMRAMPQSQFRETVINLLTPEVDLEVENTILTAQRLALRNIFRELNDDQEYSVDSVLDITPQRIEVLEDIDVVWDQTLNDGEGDFVLPDDELTQIRAVNVRQCFDGTYFDNTNTLLIEQELRRRSHTSEVPQTGIWGLTAKVLGQERAARVYNRIGRF